ncbi:unnamed protein product (macronuclear) [Paramecium tetraurelia]|uniref:Response regulatory domain-containing protein n=1 Tax=Paramecium tetraurelia TaxID=5888 RepID=A0DM00_PARTE|nr:uncharacterized protein GSPATT00018285001 [Paramecium tetraurelia]CAK84067.1 unnamed protein product [Paramecium tetraurelia]|eukprot:XP_001451464.1 hypothetical protein (macronuclear) [Paramecium tetraurelia strain d4-2]
MNIFQRVDCYFLASFPIIIYQLVLEVIEYQVIEPKTLGFQVSSASIIFIFQFYSFFQQNDVTSVAEQVIIKQLLENSYIKIFTKNLEDLTPNILLSQNTSAQTIFTTRNKFENQELIPNSVNKELKIKSFLNSDIQLEESADSEIESPNKYQTFKNLRDFIISFVSNQQTQNTDNLIVASEIDIDSGKKQKFKVIINTEIQRYYIIAFIKIDSAIVRKQRNSIAKFKTRLANNFTHKLKTSLNSTLAYLSNATNDRNVDKHVLQSYIHPSYIHSKIQLYQVQDLLDYLNKDQDQIGLQVTKFNLQQSLSQIYEFIEYQCKVKNITVKFLINGNDWKLQENQFYLYSDCQKFERVLFNLINNSYRFAPLNGELTIDLVYDSANNKLHVKINDSGEGIPEDQLNLINTHAQLQNKFNVTNKYVSAKNKSKFGLTLQITNKLIYMLSDSNCSLQVKNDKQQGGCSFEMNSILEKESKQSSIRQQNKINRSSKSSSQRSILTRNQFFDPIEDEPKPLKPRLSRTYQIHESRYQNNQIKRPTLSGIRDLQLSHVLDPINLNGTPNHQDNRFILIVDDEPFNHNTLTLMLQKLGHKQFLYSFNGQECIDKVKQNPLGIKTIFMDLDMPIMGGLQATQILIKMMTEGKIDYIPIIGCTAHDDFETQIKCLKIGMAHVVTKPVFIKSLQEAYRQIREEQIIQEHRSVQISNSLDKY